MNPRVPIAAIAFDLDGTLLDSAPGIAVALNAALEACALPPVAPQTVRTWIGDGPDALIRRALEACHRHDVDPMKVRRHFDTVTLNDPRAQGKAFAGIAELLAALTGRYPLAVVSNKPTLLARVVLDAGGLLGYFSSVHGADLPAQRKPAPLLIEQAAQRLGLASAHLLMVGDSPLDIQAARAAGCRAAWVAWGYGEAPDASDAWQLHAPADLLALLGRHTLAA